MSEATRDGLMEELDEALQTAPQAWEMQTGSVMPQDLMRDKVARRAFLQRMGVAGLGVAAVGLLNGCNGSNDDNNGGPIVNPTAGPTNGGGTATATPAATARPGVDQRNFPGIVGDNINQVVLNFTLAHEYGETDLYRQALNIATGRPITTPLAASASAYNTLRIPAGALNAASGQAAADALLFLRNQAFVEYGHRDFLISTLRSMNAPIQQPNPYGYKFVGGNPSDLRGLLSAIVAVEENGQRGILGSASFLTTLDLIQTGATLHSIEARHIASIFHLLGLNPGPRRTAEDQLVTPNYPSPDTFEYFRTPPTVISIDRRYFRAASEAQPTPGGTATATGTATTNGTATATSTGSAQIRR